MPNEGGIGSTQDRHAYLGLRGDGDGDDDDEEASDKMVGSPSRSGMLSKVLFNCSVPSCHFTAYTLETESAVIRVADCDRGR
jgi:hypothetical protein